MRTKCPARLLLVTAYWEADAGIGRVIDLEETMDDGVLVPGYEHKGEGGALLKLKATTKNGSS